jgi:ABC-type xylose transport system permease subunit
MLSMKTTMNLSNSSINMEFIRYIKCAGVLVSPNDITKYSYECSLRNVFWMDLVLMITLTEIDLSIDKLIKKNVDVGAKDICS